MSISLLQYDVSNTQGEVAIIYALKQVKKLQTNYFLH
jgi:hypothetical protein